MAEIRLNDIDGALLEDQLDLPTAVEPLTERNWGRGVRRNFREPFTILRQERLLYEQQPERLERLCKLFRHRAMYTAVEVQADVHPLCLCRFDALDHLFEDLGRSDPVEFGGRVHLDRTEALILAHLGGLGDLVRPITADPGVGPDPV